MTDPTPRATARMIVGLFVMGVCLNGLAIAAVIPGADPVGVCVLYVILLSWCSFHLSESLTRPVCSASDRAMKGGE